MPVPDHRGWRRVLEELRQRPDVLRVAEAEKKSCSVGGRDGHVGYAANAFGSYRAMRSHRYERL